MINLPIDIPLELKKKKKEKKKERKISCKLLSITTKLYVVTQLNDFSLNLNGVREQQFF